MKIKELRALSDEELDKKLKEARAELFRLRSQVVQGPNDKTLARRKELRKIIARILTLKNTKIKNG